MTHTPIDGDIADFIDSMELASEYRTEELRAFLLNEGHSEDDVAEAIQSWQGGRFQRSDPSWEAFTLTPLGLAAVKELGNRL